jgi:hypothetical protein
MFGKYWEKHPKYWTIRIDFDDPRTRRAWFTFWYSFVGLTLAASFILVLIHAPFNPLGILVCVLAFTAYILNTSHVRLIHPFNTSIFWLLLYALLLYFYISYIHPYVSFLYSLNIFIVWLSCYYRCYKLVTPATRPVDAPPSQ